MPRPALYRAALPGAVVLALLIVFVVAWTTAPGPARVTVPAGHAAAVTSVTRSCPPSVPGASAITTIAVPGQSAGRAVTGTATFSAVSVAASGGGSGTAASGTAASGASRPVTVSAPGAVATVKAARGGTAVAASGIMAAGFEAEQSDVNGTGLVSCAHPGSDMWFAGAGQAAGASEMWLYLVNTGAVTASANLTILTDTGQQNGLSNAITVLPGQSVKEDIAPLVGGSQTVALHVQTTTGQVAVSAWEGGKPGGAWLPQATAPSTSLVIPGLTVARSAAKLFVVVPGTTDAQLKVTAYTPSGAVAQFTGNLVDASAGAATPLTLNSLGASAAGLRLTSNVPVVASVLVPGNGIGAFTAGVSPVTEQGVVAGNPGDRGVTVGLLLTAPAAAARASISVISADGSLTRPAADQDVAVAAGHSLALAVPRPPGARQPFAIVVTPSAGGGPLYAVRVVTSGTGGLSAPVVSLLPVQSALTSITVPPAKDSYQAVLPSR